MALRIRSERVRRNLLLALKAVSFGLALKGAIGGSLATLAIFGVTVPWLGIQPTPVGESLAALAGAILGVVAAVRA